MVVLDSNVASIERPAGRDAGVMGGDAGRQCLAAGLIGELHIHLVPVLLGRGIRLFQHPDAAPVGWEVPEVTQSPRVTHLRYHTPSRDLAGDVPR